MSQSLAYSTAGAAVYPLLLRKISHPPRGAVAYSTGPGSAYADAVPDLIRRGIGIIVIADSAISVNTGGCHLIRTKMRDFFFPLPEGPTERRPAEA